MSLPVHLYGGLATHRRGAVLREAISATACDHLPDSAGFVLAFAEDFQKVDSAHQTRLLEWSRTPGRVLALVPPFLPSGCDQPVFWKPERLAKAPPGGAGLAAVLRSEVTHRLSGRLTTPTIPGAVWSDLSVCLGTYRAHPAAGLFAVTCLPLWSLRTLDIPAEVRLWVDGLAELAGEARMVAAEPAALTPAHFGMLVFLLSANFPDEEAALAALTASRIFGMSAETGRRLMKDLRGRGLLDEAQPCPEAYSLVTNSPYACYVTALREHPAI